MREMLFRRTILFVAFFYAASLQTSRAQEVRVAAAADLKFALDDLASEYKKQTGVTVAPTYGSSGNFFMQIQNGAPFDIFLSADVEYPRKLLSSGFAEPGTLVQFATGRIVLWVRQDSPLNLSQLGLKTLLDPTVKKIAIANPEHAPYGRAAVVAMQHAGMYDQVRSKFVYGENISQTAQFVQSGNAETGIIALSLALSPAMQNGKRWDIPSDTYSRIEQAAVILKSAKDKASARGFLNFLHSESAKIILRRYGFDTPTTANAPTQP